MGTLSIPVLQEGSLNTSTIYDMMLWHRLPNSVTMKRHCYAFKSCPSHLASHKCIGAKLKILLHFMFLSSCPTTPFNRLPIGSPFLLMRTHALSSKRTTLPSLRWYFFFVRTTTACLISPRRTLFAAETETAFDSAPKLRCFWTTTMMRSPAQK